VNYHRLLDIGRGEVEKQVPRSLFQRAIRWLLLTILPQRRLFSPLMKTGQWLRPIMPAFLKEKIPPRTTSRRSPPATQHSRKMLLLEGCVQPAMAPNINIATARVLDTLGISLEPAPGAGCCGALRHHLNAHEAARNDMRRNIDAWWPALEAGAEAVVINTSGCAPQVKDYATLLADDPEYAEKAEVISRSSFDIAEILQREEKRLLEKLDVSSSLWAGRKLAFQSPCTLQHGQGITGTAERLLIAAGCDLVSVADGHLCCGSAGTYSIFQPKLSKQLRANKVSALTAGQPEAIATANIGCLSHLQPAVDVPVRHWVEIIDEALSHSKSGPTEA
jgi:glycolate oxidase iron-sulfur subunit